MGLLEKAQQKKGHTAVAEELLLVKAKKPQQPAHQQKETTQNEDNQQSTEAYRIALPEKTTKQPRSLLGKPQQKKAKPERTQQTQPPEQKTTETPKSLLAQARQKKVEALPGEILQIGEKKIQIIEEQKGFGWKKQGTKRIIYDHTNHEYVFEVIEPQLNEEEKQTKNEIS
ncbi:MAG: hypothetical protein NTZ75_03245, partial [Euryarchaeota archaeon]|nr:hypothetical protein [Euryarchaeota archaeon]